MNDRNQQGRRFYLFFFLIPLIICGVAFFYFLSEYNMQQDEVYQLQSQIASLEFEQEHLLSANAAEEELLIDYLLDDELYNINGFSVEDFNVDEVERLIPMPSGDTVVLSDTNEGLILTEWDIQNQALESSYLLNSNIFRDIVFAYQNNGLVIATKGQNRTTSDDSDKIYVYYYEYGTEPVLVEMPVITMMYYLDSESYAFNNCLYLLGNNEQGDYVLVVVDNGEAEIVNFSEFDNIENIVASDFSRFGLSDLQFPVVELRTYDNKYYYVVFNQIASQDYTLYADEPWHSIEANVLDSYFSTANPLLKADEANLANELFYPNMHYLNANHLMIIGADTLSDNTTQSLYVVDESGENILFERQNSEAFVDYDSDEFSTHLINNKIYISSPTVASVIELSQNKIASISLENYEETFKRAREIAENNSINLRNEAYESQKATAEAEIMDLENEINRIETENKGITLDKAISFVLDDTIGQTLTIMLIVFTIIPVVVIGIPHHSERKRARDIEQAFNNGGGEFIGSIENIERTGVTVNDYPQVNLTIAFTYRQQTVKKQAKALADSLNPPKIGDLMSVYYDPIKDKMILPGLFLEELRD